MSSYKNLCIMGLVKASGHSVASELAVYNSPPSNENYISGTEADGIRFKLEGDHFVKHISLCFKDCDDRTFILQPLLVFGTDGKVHKIGGVLRNDRNDRKCNIDINMSCNAIVIKGTNTLNTRNKYIAFTHVGIYGTKTSMDTEGGDIICGLLKRMNFLEERYKLDKKEIEGMKKRILDLENRPKQDP